MGAGGKSGSLPDNRLESPRSVERIISNYLLRITKPTKRLIVTVEKVVNFCNESKQNDNFYFIIIIIYTYRIDK